MPNSERVRIGIGSYTYVWAIGVPGFPQPARPLTAFALVETAATLGVQVVQIADNLPLHLTSNAELDRLLARADERGLELEVGTCGVGAERLARYVEIAQRLRSRILRVVIDEGADQPAPDEVIARLGPLMGWFERANVTLAIENHDRFKAVALLEIVERLRSRHVGACLDTANSLGCMEGIEHVVETLGPRVVNLHVKDVRVMRAAHHKGFIVEGRPVGQGQLDVPWLLRRLREFGVKPNAIVELWPPLESSLEGTIEKEAQWARESVAYLRSLVEPAGEGGHQNCSRF